MDREARYEKIEDLPREKLLELLTIFAKDWLALDGLWFQSIEQKRGMDEAMEHDANAWARFTVLEARRIKALLGLPARAGVEGLRRALRFRLYAPLNEDEIEVAGGALTYRVTSCRVQAARERKGMPLHPCKSVGILEYTGFAREIDDRFEVECLSCHPDRSDETCKCAWRFVLRRDEDGCAQETE